MHAHTPMRIRAHITTLTVLIALPTLAQVRVDRSVVLDGSTATDRQLIGLHDGVNGIDALNARTLQRGTYLFAEVTGGVPWQAGFQPAPVLGAGLCLTLLIAEANTGPVTLSVNGTSPIAVLKDGDQPLVAGDVAAGELVSLVFDGTAFQVISARRMDRKPCPAGSVDVNGQYCIETAEREPLLFDQAAVACAGAGMRMCTWGQWYAACVQAGTLGLQDMTGNWEWTNSSANGDLSVRTVGVNSCTIAGIALGFGTDGIPRTFRCCFNR